MFRVRNNRKRWRLKWPWRLLFPLKVDERFCRECGMPYLYVITEHDRSVTTILLPEEY